MYDLSSNFSSPDFFVLLEKQLQNIDHQARSLRGEKMYSKVHKLTKIKRELMVILNVIYRQFFASHIFFKGFAKI